MQLGLARRATAAGLALVAAGLAGCGGRSIVEHRPVQNAQWIANATGVIDQLRSDVSTAQPAGAGLAVARRQLHDDSDLFVLLVAYTDFGGCSRMVAGVGPAPARFDGVAAALASACVRFERGARLFTRATSQSDAHALVAASKQIEAASRLLYRATLGFAAARVRAGT